MTARPAHLHRLDPATGFPAHLVHLYDDPAFLVESVTHFLGAGLAVGEAAIVIATQALRTELEARLRKEGLDLAAAERDGRYVSLDAEATLAQFLRDGWPDERGFADTVERIVEGAARSGAPRVRAFGEMISLLAARGDRDAAVRLEELWNELLHRKQGVSLLCAYSLADFGNETGGASLRRICAEHSAVIPAETYSMLSSGAERLRIVAELEQQAKVLEAVREDQRRAAQSLEHEQRRAAVAQAQLAAIVESSDDAIVGKTLAGIVTSWNQGAERIFGYTAEEMVGQPIARLVPNEQRDDLTRILGAVRRGDRIDHYETLRMRKDGQRIHVSLTVSPIRDTAGNVIGASKIARDVTGRRRSEELLREANAAKDEFLAMLGHELRNPLAAVQSAVATAWLDESRRDKALDIARRQTEQLRRLVDDLLDVARISRGKIALQKSRTYLSGIVGRAIETVRVDIEEHRHALSVSVAPELVVEADAGRLEQVLVNLLTNAAKYTPPGGNIALLAEPAGDELLIRVRDDGIGLNAEMLPRMFEPFAQGARGLDRAQGGLGLGLALARRLVELHGGRIDAQSDGPGRGAEFVVRLPAVLAGSQRSVNVSDPLSRGAQTAPARVLIVEDHLDAADALAMLLELLGHGVEVVHDGLAALASLRHRIPDVMLVDIGLPGMDGFELAKRTREVGGERQPMLVALTGYGRDQDRQRTRAAGFDAHLTKPVELEALRDLLARAVPSAAPA